MSWSLFRITQIDTSDITRELKRLADIAEVRLRLEHNYHLTPPKPLDEGDSPEAPTAEYASDEKLANAEIKEQVSRYQAIVDEADEVDPL